MSKQQLFPRPRRRLRQPTKDVLRENLALAADEIMRLRHRLSLHCDPDAPYRIVTLRRGFDLPTKHQNEAHVRGLLPKILRILRRQP